MAKLLPVSVYTGIVLLTNKRFRNIYLQGWNKGFNMFFLLILFAVLRALQCKILYDQSNQMFLLPEGSTLSKTTRQLVKIKPMSDKNQQTNR